MRIKAIDRVMAYLSLVLMVLQLGLVLASWVLTAAMPESFPRALPSAEGIRWFMGNFVSFLQSPLLVWLLLIAMTYGAVHGSGIMHYDRREYRQRIAMRIVSAEMVSFAVILLLLVVVPHAILLNVIGELFPSSFTASLVPYFCLAVIVGSLSFGTITNRLRSIPSLYDALVWGIGRMGGCFVVYLLSFQLYYSVTFVLTP